jgi:inner membrane protease ATP23
MRETDCTLALAHLLQHDKQVKELIASIVKASPGALVNGITCRSCVGTTVQGTMAYYDPNYQRIVICCEYVKTLPMLQETLMHELVHAQDYGKHDSLCAPYKDDACAWSACLEVRASILTQCANVWPSLRKRCVLQNALQSCKKACKSEDRARYLVGEFYKSMAKLSV